MARPQGTEGGSTGPVPGEELDTGRVQIKIDVRGQCLRVIEPPCGHRGYFTHRAAHLIRKWTFSWRKSQAIKDAPGGWICIHPWDSKVSCDTSWVCVKQISEYQEFTEREDFFLVGQYIGIIFCVLWFLNSLNAVRYFKIKFEPLTGHRMRRKLVAIRNRRWMKRHFRPAGIVVALSSALVATSVRAVNLVNSFPHKQGIIFRSSFLVYP